MISNESSSSIKERSWRSILRNNTQTSISPIKSMQIRRKARNTSNRMTSIKGSRGGQAVTKTKGPWEASCRGPPAQAGSEKARPTMKTKECLPKSSSRKGNTSGKRRKLPIKLILMALLWKILLMWCLIPHKQNRILTLMYTLSPIQSHKFLMCPLEGSHQSDSCRTRIKNNMKMSWMSTFSLKVTWVSHRSKAKTLPLHRRDKVKKWDHSRQSRITPATKVVLSPKCRNKS